MTAAGPLRGQALGILLAIGSALLYAIYIIVGTDVMRRVSPWEAARSGLILYASPSPVTSLSVWELRGLMHMPTVKKVMTQKLVTIAGDAPLEEAAILMVSYKIGGLPVVQGKNLIGIITETDLFKVFLNLLGGRRPGVRITVLIPNVKGTIAQISKAIFNAGGNIVGLGTIESPKTDNEMWECVFKVQGVSQAQLMDIVRPVVHEITDIRSQC